MLGLIATIVSACVAAGILSTALAGEPHWAKEEGFGLAVIPEQEHYVVTTFIPRSLLLYDVDPAGPDQVPGLGPKYASATTQDGVRIYMLEENISNNTFAKGRGRHELIFNVPATLCRIVQCDKNDDTQVWRISAGEAFKIDDPPAISTDDTERILTLVSDRHGEEIRAYLRHSILKRLIARGIVTRSDFDHPRYDISRTDSTIANTVCDEVISKEIIWPSALSPIDRLVIEEFELGDIGSQQGSTIVRFTSSYGGEQEAYRFFVYDVKERGSGAEFKIVAAVAYECTREGFRERMLRIRYVDLLVLGQPKKPYRLEPFETPTGLIDFTKAPYLWSVNNYSQYEQLIGQVSDKLQNRSLASYFISEYNRSCSSRRRSDPRCSGHAYRE